jgi:hypothetical protein
MGRVWGVVVLWGLLCTQAWGEAAPTVEHSVLPRSTWTLDGWTAGPRHASGFLMETVVPPGPAPSGLVTHPGFSLGWVFGKADAQWALRVGYRRQLDAAVDLGLNEVPIVLTSGSTLEIRAGTVAHVHFNLQGFREIEGQKRFRFDAVPGIRLTPRGWPLSPGVGVALTVRQVAATRFEHQGAVLFNWSKTM